MTLTTQQVNQITEQVKQHIPYYDLQMEMVDHLASNTEEMMEQDNSLDFEKALQMAYACFGSSGSGFKLLIRKRRKALVKQKWQLWFQLLVNQVTTAQVLISLSVFAIAAYSASFWEKGISQFALQLVILIYFTISLTSGFFIGAKTKHKLLFTETFRASVLGIVLKQMIFWTAVQPLIDYPFGFAAAATGFFLMIRATLGVNKSMQQKAQTLYPEAFIKA